MIPCPSYKRNHLLPCILPFGFVEMKSTVVVFSLLCILTYAQDTSQPCFNGICSHTFEPTASAMGGTIIIVSVMQSVLFISSVYLLLKQSGSSSSISDITLAAGWEILNCSSSTSAQTIRLVCTGDEESCNHLLDNGAENTIVRLPSNVGTLSRTEG